MSPRFNWIVRDPADNRIKIFALYSAASAFADATGADWPVEFSPENAATCAHYVEPEPDDFWRD